VISYEGDDRELIDLFIQFFIQPCLLWRSTTEYESSDELDVDIFFISSSIDCYNNEDRKQ